MILREGAEFISLQYPVSPYPINLGGAISPPKFRGGASEAPCFIVFFGGGPPPKFRG